MNRVLQPDPRERFAGRLYAAYPHTATTYAAVSILRTQGKFFKFDYATPKRTTESYPINNLRSKDERMSIVTHWAVDFAQRQYVLIGNQFWMIETVYAERDMWDNSPNGSTAYTLELIKVANPAGMKV